MLCGRPMRASHYPACISSPTGCHTCFTARFCRSPVWQGSRPADLQQGHGAPADRLHADRSYPSALCCAGGLPPGFLCQGAIRDAAWKGEHAAPGPGSVQVKIQDRDNQLCFQPTAQIFVHLGTGIAVRAIARPCRQRGDVAGVMPDYPAHRFGGLLRQRRRSPGKGSAMPACTQI